MASRNVLSSGVTVRPLRACDGERVCELMTESFEGEWTRAGFDVRRYRRLFRWLGAANPLLERIRWDAFKVLVAVADGEVVGSAIAYPVEPGVWFQSAVNVQRGLRGKGIVSLLYRRRLEGIRALGGRWACVEVAASNEVAIRIWRDRYGLKPYRSHTIYLVDPDKVPSADSCPGEVVSLTGTEPWIGEHHPLRAQLIRSPHSLRCSMATVLRFRMFPPVTISTWGCVQDGRLVAASRIRMLHPVRLRFMDFVWSDEGLSVDVLRRFISRTLKATATGMRYPLWVHVRCEHAAMHELCELLSFQRLLDSHFFLMDVAQVLSATSSQPLSEAD